jgi:aminomethyltransferase
MVEFAGYLMPIQYRGVVDEHRAVRTAAGLFDVSHMGEVSVRGPDAAALVERLTPAGASRLDIGRATYSCLTTPDGTIVDDLLVYRRGDDRFLLVINAANHAKDVSWIREHVGEARVEVEDVSDATALLALQGPAAKTIAASIAEGFDPTAIKFFRFAEGRLGGRDVVAARTGYTGEIGFEIFCEPDAAPALWDALLAAGGEHGLEPAGLGARDTLRLEAGLPLYGNDIDRTTNVIEAGLEFAIDWDNEHFLGRDVLERVRDEGPSRRRVGFEITGRGIARHGHRVLLDGTDVGTVSSGSFSPTLEKAIGMTYLPADRAAAGTEIEIDVRGRRLPARVIDLPFYRRRKSGKKRSGGL